MRLDKSGFGQAWYGRLGKVRFGLVLCGLLGQAWLVRCDMVRTGWVFSGRLGEVGIGVVCKVLSGRQGGVRSYWVRRDLTRFGVAGTVRFGRLHLGMVRCGSFWQARWGVFR